MQCQYLQDARYFANTWDDQYEDSKAAFKKLMAHFRFGDEEVQQEEWSWDGVWRRRPYCCNRCQ